MAGFLFVLPSTKTRRPPSLTRERVLLDGIGLFVAMMTGYRLFLNFAATEGVAHVQLKTELAFAHAIQTTLAPPGAVSKFGN